MSQYSDAVQRQRDILEAEVWALGVRSLHAHSLPSMWYDNRPQDTADGKGVVDTQYNSGLIVRITHDGQEILFGERVTGQKLLDSWRRHN